MSFAIGSCMTDKEAMALAIREAKKGLGHVSLNPPVGCVVLDHKGCLLAKGFHKKWGADHAEIDALKKITDKSQLKGSRWFVTLEPCAFHGKTPSCALELSRHPIAELTYGLVDPHPLVEGRGHEMLTKAGIRVRVFEGLSKELLELCEVFVTNQKHKRAFIALKVASSLDGKMALADGSSKWITGEKARDHVHLLRGIYDSILVGVGTVLADDPKLNIRHSDFKGKTNKIFVVDPRGEIINKLAESQLFQYHTKENISLVIQEEHLPKAVRALSDVWYEDLVNGFRYLCFKTKSLDWNELAAHALDWGVGSILVEGGRKVHSSLLEAEVVDRIYFYLNKIILGKGL